MVGALHSSTLDNHYENLFFPKIVSQFVLFVLRCISIIKDYLLLLVCDIGATDLKIPIHCENVNFCCEKETGSIGVIIMWN